MHRWLVRHRRATVGPALGRTYNGAVDRPGLPPLPGVDPANAPDPDSPRYSDWVESVAFSPEGVDRLLIWAALHQTAEERLRALQAMANFPPLADADRLR